MGKSQEDISQQMIDRYWVEADVNGAWALSLDRSEVYILVPGREQGKIVLIYSLDNELPYPLLTPSKFGAQGLGFSTWGLELRAQD